MRNLPARLYPMTVGSQPLGECNYYLFACLHNSEANTYT
jgi:hypothetical protein